MTKDKKDNKEIIQKKLMEHQNEARVVRKIVLSLSILIFLIAVAVVGGGYLYIKSALKPLEPKSNQQKLIEIPIGSSVASIGQTLESKGIIKNAKVFKYYVKLKNESGFMAGDYQLSPSMDIPEIVSRLKTGKLMAKPAITIVVPEGTQLKEISHLIAGALHKKDDEVFKKMNNKTLIKAQMAKYPNILSNEILDSKILYPLEGYLYPATYSFYKKHPTVDEVVDAMLDKTNSVFSAYQEERQKEHLSVHQLITMASLVEEEATEKADRNKIASVFYNRIKAGMPLQTDPTVLYAQGKHKDRVLYQDLKVNSPYNTYIHVGLPPGPISNAGKISIEAALKPAKTKYYYFLATPDGNVIFTKTLAEHNVEKAKHLSSKK